jgi:hypothetical protein
VIVARAGGCGARTPLEDRVRVLAYDGERELPQRSGREIGLGICPIALPDLDYSTLDTPSKTRSIDVSTNDRGRSHARRPDTSPARCLLLASIPFAWHDAECCGSPELYTPRQHSRRGPSAARPSLVR